MEIKLKYDTPKEWANQVLENLDEFLQDHADAERKVSTMCMSIIAKYPDRNKIVAELTQTAVEELLHFKQVYALMQKRGINLNGKFNQDTYLKGILPHVRTSRDGRFLDRLIIASIAEMRGVERFKLLGEAAQEEDIKKFYTNLYQQEKVHVDLFLKMATNYFSEKEIKERLEELLIIEAEVTSKLPWRPAIH